MKWLMFAFAACALIVGFSSVPSNSNTVGAMGVSPQSAPICNGHLSDNDTAAVVYCWSSDAGNIGYFRAWAECVDGFGDYNYAYGPRRLIGRGLSSIAQCPWPFYAYYWGVLRQ